MFILSQKLSLILNSPLIELVKTPGRKKAVSKKLKPLSKLNNVVSLSFEVFTVLAAYRSRHILP